MSNFDWHSEKISTDTPVRNNYKNTQNVRRFLTSICGPEFKFNSEFMTWIKDETPKTMGNVALKWKHQHQQLKQK